MGGQHLALVDSLLLTRHLMIPAVSWTGPTLGCESVVVRYSAV